MTTHDTITAVNAWADYLATIPLGRLDPRTPDARALRRAGTTALAMVQDWTEVEKRDGQHIVLEAPDGTRVLYTYAREGEQWVERLTIL
jgi:hypothetical protein